jgi:soluble lytic murein transglycosylase-like protein
MGKRAATSRFLSLVAAIAAAASLSACSTAGFQNLSPLSKGKPLAVARAELEATPEPFEAMAFVEQPRGGSAAVNGLISKYAAHYDVPEALIHRVVQRESGYNPGARNGPHWGLMQIRHDTARTMGYRGDAGGLLDADTNLRYAVKYLRGAYIVGGYSQEAAVRLYARGYYYDAKRQGLLEESGLRN